MALLELNDVRTFFKTKRGTVKAVNGVSYSLDSGKVLGLVGESGSGKTTLLRCLNFLETPNSGVITVKGETLFDSANPETLKEKNLRTKRLHFGMVFQSFNLFPQYTALENVTLAEKLLAKERPDFKQNKKEIYAEIKNLA